MSKYDALEKYLKTANQDFLPMSFQDIENIIGSALPASSRKHRAYWSNNPSNNVMTAAWLKAGFETLDVDMRSRKLIFKRAKSIANQNKPFENKDGKHPIFGALKDYFIIPHDLDLTEPLWENNEAFDDFA